MYRLYFRGEKKDRKMPRRRGRRTDGLVIVM